jgi:hypothetical protein
VPLDVADAVTRNLDANLSESELEQVAGGWYPLLAGDDGHLRLSDGLSALTAAIPSHLLATARSRRPSGGGGGWGGDGGVFDSDGSADGGFSDGGGGNGGGGGGNGGGG